MKVTVQPRAPGDRRVLYDVLWNSWALPLLMAVGTSFFPTEHSTTELDDRWLTQRTLIVRVLCMRLRVVLSGPLFTKEEAE